MSQLEDALENKKEQKLIEDGIKHYISFFGVQEQIEGFFNIFKELYPSTKLDIETLVKGAINMWRPAMIVNSILD